jgi:hypothetical protein
LPHLPAGFGQFQFCCRGSQGRRFTDLALSPHEINGTLAQVHRLLLQSHKPVGRENREALRSNLGNELELFRDDLRMNLVRPSLGDVSPYVAFSQLKQLEQRVRFNDRARTSRNSGPYTNPDLRIRPKPGRDESGIGFANGETFRPQFGIQRQCDRHDFGLVQAIGRMEHDGRLRTATRPGSLDHEVHQITIAQIGEYAINGKGFGAICDASREGCNQDGE